MNELSEFTSGQLLEELLSRPTFAGFVVCSEEEAKRAKAHRRWCMTRSQNITIEQVRIVLKEMFNKLEAIS